MKKILLVGGIGLILLVAVVMGVRAYGPQATSGQYHDQMQQVMTGGTYDDLVALREETGRQMMPWVQDAATFKQAQEHHATMVAQYGEDLPRGKGMMGGSGRQGCPMGRNQ